MGLVNPYMVKNVVAAGVGATLELEADPGQSFLVKDILIGDTTSAIATITVDKALVGEFRTGGSLGSHLTFPTGMCSCVTGEDNLLLRPESTILKYLSDRDIFKGYPIAEGQKMVISGDDPTNRLSNITILYEEHEGGGITSEMENGSESTEYMIINYGRAPTTMTIAGDYHIDTQTSPTEFPTFPYGKVVPAKTEIELLGILGSECYDADPGDILTYTEYLKLVQERTVLFDDDRNGLPFYANWKPLNAAARGYGQGYSVVGNFSDVDIKQPYMLPKPITFGPGEELNMYITCGQGTNPGEIALSQTEIGLILMIRRVS